MVVRKNSAVRLGVKDKCMKKLFENQETDAEWYAVNLLDETATVKTDVATVCYFMVEHTSDEAFMDALATRLIGSGCREYLFWGKERDKWHFAFDLADIRLDPNFTCDTIIMTSDSVTWENLVEDVVMPTVTLNIWPERFILFYDDAALYERLCRDCEAYVRNNME